MAAITPLTALVCNRKRKIWFNLRSEVKSKQGCTFLIACNDISNHLHGSPSNRGWQQVQSNRPCWIYFSKLPLLFSDDGFQPSGGKKEL